MTLAHRLRSGLRETDRVARLGGDEFGILVEDCRERADVERVAGKALAMIARPMEIRGRQVGVTASIGVSLLEDPNTDAEDLLEQADHAMYRCKERGAGVVFHEDLEVPEEHLAAAKKARHDMLEVAAEHDEELLDLFVEDEECPVDLVMRALRTGCLAMELTPVLCGSALKHKGVRFVLDAVVDYLPSPLDVPPVQGTVPRTDEVQSRSVEDGQPMSLMAFKTIAEKLKVSEGTVRNRVGWMKSSGMLRIVAVADPTAMNYRADAMLGIKIASGSTPAKVGERLAVHPEVVYILWVSGRFDLLVEIVSESEEDFLAFLSKHCFDQKDIASLEVMTGLAMYKNQFLLKQDIP